MTIAVTGATGFVGRRLIAQLQAAGHAVRALVRPGTTLAGIECAPWSLDDGATGAAAALAGATGLVHLAAYIPADHGRLAEAEACWRRNALATLQLVEAAAEAGVGHVVHTATGNAYARQDRPVRENDPLYPSARATAYLASKLAGEIYADAIGRARDVPVAVLRLSAVYGPGMVAAGMVPTFAQRLARGDTVVLDSGGRYQVDLVHVDDVVAAIAAALAGRARGPYNVGSGQAVTSLEVATILARAAGRDPDAPAVIEVRGDRAGGPVAGFAPLAIERARADLGYRPRSAADGLAGALQWF